MARIRWLLTGVFLVEKLVKSWRESGGEENKVEDREGSKQRVKEVKGVCVGLCVCVCVCVCGCETWQNEAWPTGRSVPYVSWRKRETCSSQHNKSLFRKDKTVEE